MSRITDTDGNPLTHVALVQQPETVSAVIVVRVACAAGQYLAVSAEPTARVLARRTGSGNAFVDLADEPISLTEFDGLEVTFDLKVSTSATASRTRVALPVKVTYQP